MHTRSLQKSIKKALALVHTYTVHCGAKQKLLPIVETTPLFRLETTASIMLPTPI